MIGATKAADDGAAARERRDFLRLMGASLALAGGVGCDREAPDTIVPYAVAPPELVPGRARHYATSLLVDGHGVGVLATCRDGRPTKLEGNPEHPASLGAAGRREQAALLGLYDPDRARLLREGREPRSWAALARAFGPGGDGGRGLHVLLEPTTSPLVAALVARVREARPGARFHYWRRFDARRRWQGARLAFGRVVEPIYDLEAADVVVSLASDLLDEGPFALRYQRQHAERRRVLDAGASMSRLYVAEAALTVTGANADERLAVRPSEVGALAASLFAEVAAALGAGWGAPARGEVGRPLPAPHRAWVRAAARDLAARPGASLVVAGDGAPAEVHALAHALNERLGAVGKAARYVEPPTLEAGGPSHDGLGSLAAALDAGEVEALWVLGGNPAYAAPGELDLAPRLGRAKRSLYLGLYENETARACQWFVPAAHPLEAWGDARALDGTLSLRQPLVVPLYGGKTEAELLAVLAGGDAPSRGDALVRAALGAAAAADAAWQEALRRGYVEGSAAPAAAVTCDQGSVARALAACAAAPPGPELELVIVRDAKVDDGRDANNAWLQELPDPVTKLTWGNAALVGPATAARYGLRDEDEVELRTGGGAVRAPALVVPGQAEGVVAIAAGYGRRGAERVARGVGVDVTPLASAASPDGGAASMAKTGGRRELAIAQAHASLEGRLVLRSNTLAGYRRDPHFASHGDEGGPPALYQNVPGATNQWAMTIDLTVCTGCSACVVACQAENNVPVVGFDGVRNRREMHWLRVDRYFSGPVETPRVLVQPMLCQHCETAPCEYVCPVNATTHSADGLNQMTYNRCVGTRFCSNNCPYKVRRFNYFNYNNDKAPSEKLAMNPLVTVRARGVMEKCTFCVQRIREAEVAAHGAGRPIGPGEVVTACQQTCPTGAIVFGSLTAPGSLVAALGRDERAYAALGELGTRPRVRYLARLSNPARGAGEGGPT